MMMLPLFDNLETPALFFLLKLTDNRDFNLLGQTMQGLMKLKQSHIYSMPF